MLARKLRHKMISSSRRAHVAAVVAFCLALGGCDGEGTLTVITPPEQMRGPRISGQVRLPNGELAQASSAWRDLLSALVRPVQALFSPAVEPVGPGVEAELVYVDPADASGGSIPSDLPVLDAASTNDNGQYQVFLPAETTADRCRYMVRVGDIADGSLTRAFVFRSDGAVDIDFASETVVRQILAALADGLAADLCDFESADIALLYQAVLDLPGTIPGDTIAAVNANSDAAVSADVGFQALLEDASLPGTLPATRTPTATVPATLTPTGTATRTRAATATETPRATRTEAPSPTVTPSPSITSTRPTASPTSTVIPPTSSPTATGTLAPPTATSTSVVLPTNTTAAATATSTVTFPTNTTAPATSTPTRSATQTFTATPSATPQPGAATLDVGTVSGGAGMIVSVPVVLMGTGTVAVSADIEFDADVLDIVMAQGQPDCEAAPTLPANKRVIASVPAIVGLPVDRTVLRIGVIGTDNNEPLAGGTLLSCRFEINAAAPLGSTALLNTPAASDALGNEATIGGSDGSITVIATPPSLDLGMVVATSGESFTISGTLHSRGQTISALSTDIAVGTAMLDVVLGDDQTPDCVVADAIGTGSTPNKQIFAAVVPDEAAAEAGQAEGVPTEVLRIGIVATDNNQPIPDGQVFHCELAVPVAAPAQIVSLTHRPEGSSPDGMTVGLSGTLGQITIVEP